MLHAALKGSGHSACEIITPESMLLEFSSGRKLPALIGSFRQESDNDYVIFDANVPFGCHSGSSYNQCFHKPERQ